MLTDYRKKLVVFQYKFNVLILIDILSIWITQKKKQN